MLVKVRDKGSFIVSFYFVSTLSLFCVSMVDNIVDFSVHFWRYMHKAIVKREYCLETCLDLFFKMMQAG